MEELKNRVKTREERHRHTWDPFQLNPVETKKESERRCFQLGQNLVAAIVGLAVLSTAVISKGSLLVLSTLSSPTSMRSQKEKQFYTLMLVFCLVCPNFLVFIKSLWRCAFKSVTKPDIRTMSCICSIECLVSLGTSVLVLVVMPQFDVLTNLFISGGVCTVSAILQIVYRLQEEKWKIVFPVCSLILTVAGHCLHVTSNMDNQSAESGIYIGIGIFSTLLVSLCWWENPLQATNCMKKTLSNLDGYRDFVFVISSILRIIVVGGVYLFCHVYCQESIIWSDFSLNEDWNLVQVGMLLLFLQAFSSAACHWFGVVAYKIHAVRMSFALPVYCTGPAVLLLGLTLFLTQAQKSDGNMTEFCESLVYSNYKDTSFVILPEITRSICRSSLGSSHMQWPFLVLALEGVCMWLGFVACTYYVWTIKVQRIERTSQLFVRRLYESAFIDLSLLLNTRITVSQARNQERCNDSQNCLIYLCATMWHETYDEMLTILKSVLRLDRYRGDPNQAHKDCFDFDCHIYVDDAFMTEKETKRRLVNSYVKDLIQVITEVNGMFNGEGPDNVSITETPYGGRLMFVMPEGNMLYVHLKDKSLIRNKKRWSQVMYLYYLLGWKGYRAKNPQKITHQNNPCRACANSTNGQNHLSTPSDTDSKRRFISDDNTYILALDGDTDFEPEAVIQLVERLRMYYNVGAVCGRIHPTGVGPIVWYQKFEYAVGHWLLKTAEHVFGAVLCSPGCFSLLRGSAIMDDHVLKRYTATATKAKEHVQFDQGEDRWLCTLLLQRGWRVEYIAASDAYTNSPQEFEEFYNQRRRWGPSTLVNTLDLLYSGAETVKRNMSISRLYIFYQIFAVISSILGPASVTLMTAGAFQCVFNLSGTLAIIIAIIPPVFYFIVCFVANTKTQITIAAVMSVLYAFLISACLLSIIGDMVVQDTFLTPSGLFLVSMTTMHLVIAMLHPKEFGLLVYGLLYFICTPGGQILLTIYSLANMHVVSWGTRETNDNSDEKRRSPVENDDKNGDDFKTDVTTETEELPISDYMDWVEPVREEFMKKLTYANVKSNLQEQIRYALPDKHEDNVYEKLVLMLSDTLDRELGPEDILSESRLRELQSALEQKARNVLKTSGKEELLKRVKRAIDKTLSAPQVQKLDEDEHIFWQQVIEHYLKPINVSEAHQQEVTRELKSLRNKSVFQYFMINVLWLVATFFMQAFGNYVISIKMSNVHPSGTDTGEYFKVEPLGWMFLLSFVILLIIQFMAMLCHRIYALIRVVSQRNTEKNCKKRDDEDNDNDDGVDGLTVANPNLTSPVMNPRHKEPAITVKLNDLHTHTHTHTHWHHQWQLHRLAVK